MLEQRRYERVGFLCPLQLTALAGGESHSASSLDLSLGGVGLITSASLPIGLSLMVTFFCKDSVGHVMKDQVVGRVVHLTAEADANKMGIQFLNPLTEAEHPWLVGKLLSL